MLEIQARIGEWAFQELQKRHFVWKNPIRQKLEDAYCAFLKNLYPRCQEEGCKNHGKPYILRGYYLDDEPDSIYWYCWEHAKPNGFCPGCGEFWGGTESFDFGPGYCSNCAPEFEEDYYDEDAEDWGYDL